MQLIVKLKLTRIKRLNNLSDEMSQAFVTYFYCTCLLKDAYLPNALWSAHYSLWNIQI